MGCAPSTNPGRCARQGQTSKKEPPKKDEGESYTGTIEGVVPAAKGTNDGDPLAGLTRAQQQQPGRSPNVESLGSVNVDFLASGTDSGMTASTSASCPEGEASVSLRLPRATAPASSDSSKSPTPFVLSILADAAIVPNCDVEKSEVTAFPCFAPVDGIPSPAAATSNNTSGTNENGKRSAMPPNMSSGTLGSLGAEVGDPPLLMGESCVGAHSTLREEELAELLSRHEAVA